ncbi:MAG: hypothetical protein ACRDRI_07850 [Pseudonocardiaceae bacterium]
MSDAMSFTELAEQCVELLPARTVLSLLRGGTAESSGAQGTHGTDGQSIPGTTMWALVFGYDRSGSGDSGGDAGNMNR